MPEIPEQNKLEMLIDLAEFEEPLRPYLGYSQIGATCDRYLFYSFRFAYAQILTYKQRRLFDRGNQEEPIIIKDLKRIGIQCENVLEDQLEIVGCFGHAKGHPDGKAKNIPGAEKTEHLLEFKTMADKYFKEIVRFGLKRSQPQYWTQINCYMGKLGLTRCLFVATNKNDDSRYYERCHYDKTTFDIAEERASEIIFGTQLPRRLSDNPTYYECKWCDAYGICHQGQPIKQNCRTCINSKTLPDGKWGCKVYEASGPIPLHVQRTGCSNAYSPMF